MTFHTLHFHTSHIIHDARQCMLYPNINFLQRLILCLSCWAHEKGIHVSAKLYKIFKRHFNAILLKLNTIRRDSYIQSAIRICRYGQGEGEMATAWLHYREHGSRWPIIFPNRLFPFTNIKNYNQPVLN